MNDLPLTACDIAHTYGEGASFQLVVERFQLHAGEVLGIIGPNGAGKSTFLRIAAGVLFPTHGSVFLGASRLSEIERRTVARTMGYLPQETAAQFDVTVAELVAMGRFPYRSGFAPLVQRDRDIIAASIEQVELSDFAQRPLSHLSGGERKRAFLASVLAQEPKVLLLDEPVASLDLHHQVRFFTLLRALVAKGIAVAVVTHEVNLASVFSDRLLLMKEGACLANGSPGDTLTEENVCLLYGKDVLLERHPKTGRPILLPSYTAATPSMESPA